MQCSSCLKYLWVKYNTLIWQFKRYPKLDHDFQYTAWSKVSSRHKNPHNNYSTDSAINSKELLLCYNLKQSEYSQKEPDM